MAREDEVRNIAYALWVQDGYNRDSAIQHWLRAEAIWEQNQKALKSPGTFDKEQNRSPGLGPDEKTF